MCTGDGEGSAHVSEGEILTTFRKLLQQPELEPTESFFAAGGSSVLSMQAALGLQIRPAVLHAFPTARKLARHLNGRDVRRGSAGANLYWTKYYSFPCLGIATRTQTAKAASRGQCASICRVEPFLAR